jgi:pilin isopeptide linkage protein
MKKNVNKLMAVITTGILAATMSLTAFAANEIAIPKKVPTDTNNHTMAPETTFELEVTAGPSDATTVDLLGNDDQTHTYQLTPGTTEQISGMTITGAAFADITEYPTGGVYTKDFGIKVPDSIYNGLAPGVYSYTVKEKNGGYSGITYDDTTYYMYVSVINDGSGGVKVDNVVLAKADGVKIADITNDFGATNNLTHDLTITKSVTGNAGELTKEFNFNISIKATGTGASADQEFKLDDGTEAGQIIKADESPKTVKLTNGNSVHIYGLTADYDVYVSEVEAGLNGYTTTYTITNNGDGNTSVAQALEDADAKATVNALADGAILTIINDRNNVTPTGVAMDIAPYALMVVLAGSAAVTFLRKKDQFEE